MFNILKKLNKQNFPIDLVYLWVDGSDPKWAAEKDKWLKKLKGVTKFYKDGTVKSRWRDNNELLYSLRSVEKFLPWINHIYIIIGFNQVPKWLNINNPKITIIPHEQILSCEDLPTFNATTIEMGMHNIPGLAEHFLLANDDTIFNKYLKPSFFYDKHGRAIVLYNKHHDYQKNIEKWNQSVDEYTQTLILSAQVIKRAFGKTFYTGRPSHGVDPYILSSIKECISNPIIKQQLESQLPNRFRTNTEIQRWAFNIYDFITGRAIFKHCHPYKSRHRLDFIYNLLHWRSVNNSPVYCSDTLLERKSIMHAPIFCINDNESLTDKQLKQNADFLQQLFPNKSEFEIS